MPPKKPTVLPSKLNEFMHVTGCTDKAMAENILSKHNSNVNNAVEEYFASNLQKSNSGSKIPTEVLEAEFGKYNDGNNKME